MSTLKKNVLSMSILQMGNFIVPLITIPYLTRVLGAFGYGQIAFVQAVMAFLIMFVEFGFGMSAASKIAENQKDKIVVSQIFFATWAVQFIIFISLLITFLLLINYIPRLEEAKTLFLISLIGFFGNFLSPYWLLQGLEKMSGIVITQLVVRVLSIPAIFIFVDNQNDATIVILINALVMFLSGVFFLYWVHSKRLLCLVLPAWIDVRTTLIEGSYYFFSRISTAIYTNSISMVIGFIVNHQNYAYFSIADKVRLAFQTSISPIGAAVYPRICFLYRTSVPDALKLLMRSGFLIVGLSIFSTFFIFIFAEKIILIVAGKKFLDATHILKIIAFLPAITSLSYVFGMQFLIPRGFIMHVNITTFVVGSFTLALAFPITKVYSVVGTSYLMVFAEVIISSIFIIIFIKKKANI